MNNWLLILLLVSSTIELRSLVQQQPCTPIEARNPEGNYIVPGVLGSIAYRRREQTSGRDLSLDAYVQLRGDSRPAVVVVHGGNGNSGSRVAFIGQLLETLTRAGYNWFAVDYRLAGANNFREPLEDIRAAIDFIRCHAKEFRIDPNNIALVGEDTGATLAMMIASEQSERIKAVVTLGGFYDSLPNVGAPLTKNLKAMPPSLIIHGGNDRESPLDHAGQFCELLRSTGRECELIVSEGAIHRAENWLPSQWGYKALLTTWLSRRMNLYEPDHQPYVTSLEKEIVYDAPHNLKLDAYVPSGAGPHPAVIIVHGGGWEAGDRVTYVAPLFEPLARAGFAWFSIDYRLTPQVTHQEQLGDLREAIRFVRSNSTRFRIDPNRIALLGESAGAQMVVQVASERLPGIAGAISFYGVYDFNALITEFSSRSVPARLFRLTRLDENARQVMRRFSPIHNIQSDMPPVLLIHGTKDRLYSQGVAMGKMLAEMRVEYDVLELKDAPHGIENWEGRSEWLGYKQQLVEWLTRKLTATAQTSSTAGNRTNSLPRVVFDKFGPGIREQVSKADEDARRNPENGEVVGRLAMILHAYEQFETAAEIYRRALKLQPNDFRWNYLLASCQMALGQQEEAVATLRQALQNQPRYLPAKLKIADSLLVMNDITESERIYQEVLAVQPDSPHAHYGLGRTRMKRRDPKAIDSLREAVRLAPTWGAAHYALAMAYRDIGARAKAEGHIRLSREFLVIRPVQPDPLMQAVGELNLGAAERLRKGVELEASGNLAESIVEHERALEINPQLAQARINLIQLYGRRGLAVKAEEHYRAVIALNPNLADSHYNFGVMLMEQKRLDEAAQAFRRAIDSNPQFAEAHLNYGTLLEAQRQFDDAMKHYKLAVDNRPNDRMAHFQLARMLIYKNQYDEAIKHLHQTLTTEDSETPRFTYALATAYLRAGDRANGLKYAVMARDKAAALKQTQLQEAIEEFLKGLDRGK